MFRQTNPEIDSDRLARRVDIELDRPARADGAPESPDDAPARGGEDTGPGTRRLDRLKARLRAVPLLGPALVRANAWRRRLDPRPALLRVPFLGPRLRWLATLARLTQTRDRLRLLEAEVAAWGHEMSDTQHRVERIARRADQLQGEILFQQTRLDRVAAQAPAGDDAAPPAPGASDAPAAAAGDWLDSFYEAFEDRFRGDPAAIKERQAVYLDDLRAAGVGDAERPVLDLGCGRGEFLELLGESGLSARGVDSNTMAVARCRARGLDVREGDLLAALAAETPDSLGAVTAFHVIEHLPLATLIAVLDGARRVLAPGGLLILETPNPENLRVGAHSFYNDPTHRAPIPPEVAAFMVAQRGFSEPAIRRLHPFPARDRLPEETSEARLLNTLLFGPQDYAVIARRP